MRTPPRVHALVNARLAGKTVYAGFIDAVALSPAQILGVGDWLGLLEAGKDATLIVTTGDPLGGAYMDSRPVDL